LDPKAPPSEVRAAIKRMAARLEIRRIEWDRDWRGFLQSEYEHLTIGPGLVIEPLVTPPDEEGRYARAQAIVGNDTLAAETGDQRLIFRWELRCYGVAGPLTERWGGDWWGKSWPKLTPEEIEAAAEQAAQVIAAIPAG
jgi:hypothetical protein